MNYYDIHTSMVPQSITESKPLLVKPVLYYVGSIPDPKDVSSIFSSAWRHSISHKLPLPSTFLVCINTFLYIKLLVISPSPNLAHRFSLKQLFRMSGALSVAHVEAPYDNIGCRSKCFVEVQLGLFRTNSILKLVQQYKIAAVIHFPISWESHTTSKSKQ